MNNRTRAKAQRAAIAVVIALAVAKVLPAIAESLNQTPAPAPTVSAAPSDSATPTATPASPTDSPSLTAPPVTYPTATITYKMDMSDTSTPSVLETGTVVLHVPSLIKVDPRAASAAISPIYLASSHKLLVCLTPTGAQLSGFGPSSDLIVDSSGPSTLVSGDAASVAAALTGIKLLTTSRVSGASLDIRAIVVSKANTNPDFCSKPNSEAHVRVTAFGLDLNTVKVPVPLK